MARESSPERQGQDPPPGSSLPAPYRNPWRVLGDDLRAVAADLRLRLRELWRRNGEGSLALPPWWPSDRAPLFWPLLLAAALALLAAVGVAVARHGPVASPSLPLPEQPQERPQERPPQPPPAAEDSPPPAPGPAGALLPEQPPPESPPEPEPELMAPTAPPAPLPLAQADPLQEFLAQPEVEPLLEGAQADPALSSLRLRVRAAFLSQPLAQQQRWAEQWQQWALELGYEHLELRDANGQLVAREVLVGTGMIVLSSRA
ncbi:MAG: hypothetical protein EBX49_09055 [Synechococcaceae bacterium WB8_1B_136]|nr:hypothetical protein [Synechococcaceae bacterium WB8_1B_136]